MASQRLTIVKKNISRKDCMNEFKVLGTGETFSSFTSDIALAFADHVKCQELNSDYLSWFENQSKEISLELNIPSFEDSVPEIEPTLSPKQDAVEKVLIAVFAKFLIGKISGLAMENCVGCKINHPSFDRHDCIMLDNKTLTYLYLTEALQQVNEDEEAMKTFLAKTNEQCPLNGLELIRYQCKDSREDIFCRRRDELERNVIELFGLAYQ